MNERWTRDDWEISFVGELLALQPELCMSMLDHCSTSTWLRPVLNGRHVCHMGSMASLQNLFSTWMFRTKCIRDYWQFFFPGFQYEIQTSLILDFGFEDFGEYSPTVPNMFPKFLMCSQYNSFYPISFALSFILCNLYTQPKNAYFGTFQCFITFLCDAHHKRKPIEPKFEILVFPKVPHNILISFLNFQMGSQSVPQHVLKTNVMRI